MPDHSWLSRTRGRLPLEVHDVVFTWVLQRLAERGLVRGERIGVDASTMEANAALRAIVRRETGEGHREMLTRLAKENGIETPTAEDLIRLDRARKGKKLSNAEWKSPTDPEARIAKLKDGRTHLAYKPEHAVDLDTGAVVAAEMHPADRGDTAMTLPRVSGQSSPQHPSDLVAQGPNLTRPVVRHAAGLDTDQARRKALSCPVILMQEAQCRTIRHNSRDLHIARRVAPYLRRESGLAGVSGDAIARHCPQSHRISLVRHNSQLGLP